MTYKQIIDGIDVSKCQHYGKCSTHCYVVDELCSDNPNCYYKQLKRKEQELKNICKAFDIEYLIDKETGNLIGRCNKLYKKEQECEALQMSENEAGEIIAELQAYKDVNEDFKTAWEELKAENKELKKIINEAKNSKLDLKSFLVGEAIQNEYEQQLDQLKKTLIEIKEIAERDKEFCIKCNGDKEIDCIDCIEGGRALLAKQILQKISDCEVNNDNK